MRPGSLLLASAAALAPGVRGGPSPPLDNGTTADVAAFEDGVVTLPILPHRHVVERRRRELGLAPSGDGGDAPPYDRIPTRRHARGTRGAAAGDGTRGGGRGLAIQQIGALYQGYGTHYSEFTVLS